MKKVCAILLVFLILLGCTACDRAAALPLPEESMELVFCSGVGSWASVVTLYRDGSFIGEYYDVDMGEVGENYPNGTKYICHFTGKFSNIKKTNDYTYTMRLESVTAEETEGDEWIEDGLLYVGAVPYGIEGGTEFRFYLPGVQAKEIPSIDDLTTWIWGGFNNYYQKPDSVLQEYLLLNVAEECPFVFPYH